MRIARSLLAAVAITALAASSVLARPLPHLSLGAAAELSQPTVTVSAPVTDVMEKLQRSAVQVEADTQQPAKPAQPTLPTVAATESTTAASVAATESTTDVQECDNVVTPSATPETCGASDPDGVDTNSTAGANDGAAAAGGTDSAN